MSTDLCPARIVHVVGARPNFIKVSAIIQSMKQYCDRFDQFLVHTGQHFSAEMSQVFFDELLLPVPDAILSSGGGTHAQQTARIMLALEPILLRIRPAWVMVYGDVNSTLAAALVAAKLGIRVAHVEAGLRCGDRTMPEEINRVLTDQLAETLFTTAREADGNLLREGIPPTRIHFVGNVMIDTLARLLPKAAGRPILQDLGLEQQGFALATLHRPSNVERPKVLGEILAALDRLAEEFPVIFPVHPRTRANIARLPSGVPRGRLRLMAALGYLDFIALMNAARLVITDSGGVQEETTYLGVPCLTVRPSTERPVTIEIGTNRLVASSHASIVHAAREALERDWVRERRLPPLWDGRAAERITDVMLAVSTS